MKNQDDVFVSRLLNDVSDAIIAADTQFKISVWNPAAQKLYGYSQEDVLGKTFPEVTGRRYLGCSRLDALNQFDQEGFWEGEVQEVRKDGQRILVYTRVSRVLSKDGAFIGLVAINRDITRNKQLEEDLVQKANLEFMGFLIGSVSHTFNNQLTAILGSLSVSRHYASDNAKILSFLDKAERASLSIKNMMQQLMIASGSIAPVFRCIDITSIVDKAVNSFVMENRISITVSVEKNIPGIWGNESHLIQVLTHIFNNALEAMATDHDKKPMIQVDVNADATSGITSKNPEIRIKIADTGHGVSPDIQPKVFDPFFSTRGPSRGLGLPVCRSIVRLHGGSIMVSPGKKCGTEVTITLPAIRHESYQTSQNKIRILVFEPDDFMCRVICDLISEIGHNAVGFSRSSECINEFRKSRETGRSFDLVLLNTDEKRSEWLDLMKTIRHFNPEISIISLGTTSSVTDSSAEPDCHFSGWLSKPYQLDVIKTEIRKVLGDGNVF